jgi:uncharacterized membrane protein YfcA
MNPVKLAVFISLGALALLFGVVWIASARRRKERARPSLAELAVGFGTNFFDTLGIGSYAPTTSIFKLWGLVRDERIPGTMNVGHTPPTMVQAFIFIAIVAVEPRTLVLMLAAAALGAWLGAGVVAGWPRRRVQIGMGVALLVASVLLLRTNLGLSTVGGTALGLTGTRLAVGLLGNFCLGALMTLGIGLYAPCMILVSLLGMDPTVAFPIMMGSCAFLMPVASVRFIREERYELGPAVGLTLGGIPAVLIAAFAVGNMNVVRVRWLVIVVVVYTAIAMLRSAAREKVKAELP